MNITYDLQSGVCLMSSTTIINLNGTWRLGRVPQQPLSFRGDDRQAVVEWLPATVPGHVHADLMQAGKLPDLYVADHIKQASWVDEWDWWLEREVEVELKLKVKLKVKVEAGQQRVVICFDALDYIGAIWLNSSLLTVHEGAFSGCEVEITSYLAEEQADRSQKACFAVRLWGAAVWPTPEWRRWEHLMKPVTRFLLPGKASLRPFHPRLRLLRAPMQAGWDFAPALAALGLWEGVRVEVTGAVRIERVRVGAWQVDPSGEAQTDSLILLDALYATSVTLNVTWRPNNFEGRGGEVTQERRVTAGQNEINLPLTIHEAKCWSPWEQGAPNLYELTITLLIDGSPSAIHRQRVGIRTIEWDKMCLSVNDLPLFARGINWVPCDILLGTVPRTRYKQLLTMACERGVNFVRVWGGGGRERRDFYDICDELGLVVWQEFPFACAFLDHYPRASTFMRLVEQEVTAIVRQLRHHASIVLWGAGNEFSNLRNRSLIKQLARIVADEDTRPFLPPSPGQHDRHNWHVWHGKGSLETYRLASTPFLSEFGLQALPNLASLKQFLPQQALWPPNEGWTLHHADIDKLQTYASTYDEHQIKQPPQSLPAFITASQQAQAQGMQLAIEQMRRRKEAGAGGVAIWQWNEPWPAISWALIDYYGQAKAAADGLRTWYHPLLLSLDFARSHPAKTHSTSKDALFQATLWGINDLSDPLKNGEARLLQHNQLLWSTSFTLPAHSARQITTLTINLLDPIAPLRLELWQQDTLLTTNQYQLQHLGPIHSPRWLKWYRTLAEWVMRF